MTALGVAFAGAFGFALAAVGYAWVRVVESVLFPQGDPRAVVAVTESGYLMRCAVAAFVGGMGVFAGWALRRSAARGARVLVGVVTVAALGLALQAGLAP